MVLAKRSMMDYSNDKFKDLLVEFFIALKENSINYCVIGNYRDLPEHTENDVDFWVDNVDKAERQLLHLAKGLGLQLYLQNKTASGSNNYFYYILDNSVEVVKIDLMHETSYKSILTIVSSDLIEKNRLKYKAFFVTNPLIEGVMHLLYPLLAFGVVKDKYKKKLIALSLTGDFSKCLCSILGDNLGSQLLTSMQNGDWASVEGRVGAIRMRIFLNTIKAFNFRRLQIAFNFMSSLVNRIFNKNGIVISFTGIDGAGKTSIKKYLIENSDKYFAKNRVSEFYWRPFLLPRISRIVGLKCQKEIYNNSGKRVLKSSNLENLKSHMKYIYYVVDFLFGRIKYFKNTHTGGLAVFDRYHFDNIIYPERFGFNVSKKLMRYVDKYIIPQPDIIFYFTAKTEILYKRKYEIDIDEINIQKNIYCSEITFRDDIVTIDTECSLDTTVNEVLFKILGLMSQRYV